MTPQPSPCDTSSTGTRFQEPQAPAVGLSRVSPWAHGRANSPGCTHQCAKQGSGVRVIHLSSSTPALHTMYFTSQVNTARNSNRHPQPERTKLQSPPGQAEDERQEPGISPARAAAPANLPNSCTVQLGARRRGAEQTPPLQQHSLVPPALPLGLQVQLWTKPTRKACNLGK